MTDTNQKITRADQLKDVYGAFLNFLYQVSIDSDLPIDDLSDLLTTFKEKGSTLLICAHAQSMVDRYGVEFEARKSATIFKIASELAKATDAFSLAGHALGLAEVIDRNEIWRERFWRFCGLIKKLISS